MGALYIVFVIITLITCSFLNKYAVSRIHPFTIQSLQAGLNAALLPLWYCLSRWFAPHETLTWQPFTAALLAGLLSSVGFIFFLAALKDKPIFIVTACLSIYPAIVGIISTVTGTEKFSTTQIIGSVLVATGIYFVLRG